MNEFERLRNSKWVGFAHVYLDKLNKESKSNDEIDIEVFSKLVQLDKKLGTTASEHLIECLLKTTRSEIIKVLSFIGMKHI